MSRLLPRYTISSHADQLKVDKIIGTSNAADVTVTTKTKPTPGGDSRRLRGIPLTGADRSAIYGTDPLGTLIAKDNARRRKAA